MAMVCRYAPATASTTISRASRADNIGRALALLAGVPVAALHRILDRLADVAEQLRVLEGTDHRGDGEAEAGRQVEFESEGREIDLRAGFAWRRWRRKAEGC